MAAVCTSAAVVKGQVGAYEVAKAKLESVFALLKGCGAVSMDIGGTTFTVRPYDRKTDNEKYGNCDSGHLLGDGESAYLPIIIDDHVAVTPLQKALGAPEVYTPFIASTGPALATEAEWRCGFTYWYTPAMKNATFCISADLLETAIKATNAAKSKK